MGALVDDDSASRTAPFVQLDDRPHASSVPQPPLPPPHTWPLQEEEQQQQQQQHRLRQRACEGSPSGRHHAAAAQSRAHRRSDVLGPQTHRLPKKVMWGITLLLSFCMAVLNFATLLVTERLVKFKFGAMQHAIAHSGIRLGILALTVVSSMFALIGVSLIMFLAPNCTGSGLPENKVYLNGGAVPGLFSKRTLGVRISTSILANAAGFPIGREGPTVTIGSNLGFLLSKKIAKPYVKEWVDLSEEVRACAMLVDEQRMAHANRVACAVGGACAMAVIFNAPFGGLLYMFEEVTSVAWPLELTFRVFVATMCCSLLSYGLCYLNGSEIEEFVIYAEKPESNRWEYRDIPVFIIVAAMLGVITSLHTRAMLAMSARRQRMRSALQRLQPCAQIVETVAYAALCALVATTVSLLDSCTEKGESGLQYVTFNCAEGEYNSVASLLVTTSHSSVKLLFSGINAGEIKAGSSILAFVTYFILNVGLAGLPVPGGAFTATMLLGGLFGRSVGELLRDMGIVHTVSGVYAVVGSAAMLCGFKQMTLAAVLIVVECVNDLRLAPVVMLGVAVSMTVNWRMNERGHDEEVIVRKGLPFLEGEAPRELDNVAALSLCDPLPEAAILSPDCAVAAVRRALAENQVSYFPIREGGRGGPCLGVLARPRLEAALTAATAPPTSSAGLPSAGPGLAAAAGTGAGAAAASAAPLRRRPLSSASSATVGARSLAALGRRLQGCDAPFRHSSGGAVAGDVAGAMAELGRRGGGGGGEEEADDSDEHVDAAGEACPNLSRIVPGVDLLPLHCLMDPTPFTVVEDMPAPRLHALFAKAGERCVVVTSVRGELRGVISREGFIAAARARELEHRQLAIERCSSQRGIGMRSGLALQRARSRSDDSDTGAA